MSPVGAGAGDQAARLASFPLLVLDSLQSRGAVRRPEVWAWRRDEGLEEVPLQPHLLSGPFGAGHSSEQALPGDGDA